MTLFVAQN